MIDFTKYHATTHPIVKLEDDYNNIVDHAFEKPEKFLIRQNGINYESIHGGGVNQAGKIFGTPNINASVVIQACLDAGKGLTILAPNTTFNIGTKILMNADDRWLLGSDWSSILTPIAPLLNNSDVMIYATKRSRIANMQFDTRTHNFYAVDFSPSYRGFCDHNFFYGGHCLTVGGDTGFVHNNCIIAGDGKVGINIGGVWLYLTDNEVVGGEPSIRFSNCKYVKLRGGWVEMPFGKAVQFVYDISKHITISDLQILNWDFAQGAPNTGQTHGISIENASENIKIVSPQIVRMRQHGINVTGNPLDLTISDPTIKECGVDAADTYAGIYFNNQTEGAVIMGGRGTDRQVTKTQKYAVWSEGTSNYITCVGMDGRGNVNAAKDFVLAGANNILEHCQGRT